MGRVLAPWGVRGWIKVAPFTATPGALLAYKEWWLHTAGAAGPFQVVAARQHGDALVAQLAGIESPEDALRWRGAEVSVPRAALPDPGEDEVYWADLVGLAVVNRQGAVLGTVAAVEDHGAHGILRVAPAEPGTGDRLIPFVAAYVDGVDLAARRIDVDWGTDY